MSVQVKCPRCGRKQTYSKDNPYRPFCSPQCKTIDLGAWASEAYSIPGQEGLTDADELGQVNQPGKTND
jgi:uncharacterized protein